MRLRQARWISATLALAALVVALAPGRAQGQANVAGAWKLQTTTSPINAPWTPPLYPWLHLLPSGKVSSRAASLIRTSSTP
jgi:hypothetical protein